MKFFTKNNNSEIIEKNLTYKKNNENNNKIL